MNKKKLKDTGFKDCNNNPIKEGDILIGKTDELYPNFGLTGLYERGFVNRHIMLHNPSIPDQFKKGWFWNGQRLESVAKNVIKIGNILDNPELLLVREKLYE